MNRVSTWVVAWLVLALAGNLGPRAAAQSYGPLQEAEALYRTDGPAVALPVFVELASRYATPDDRADYATAIHFIGECHWRLGDFEQSRRHLDEALQVRSDLGDALGVGKTANVLGLLEWDLGNYDAAIARFREASAAGETSGDRRLQGASLNNLSLVLDELGEYQQSLDQYEEALQIYAGADFPRGEGDTHGNIGGVYLLLGRYEEALEQYEKALAISESLQSLTAISQDHGNIGLAHLGLGELDAAIEEFDQAIAAADDAGLQQDVAYWQRSKASALIRKGEYGDGLALHRIALAVYERIGARAELLAAMHDMGQIHLSLGDPGSARQYFNDAISLARDLGHDNGITTNLIALGKLQMRAAEFESARAYFGQALTRAIEAGALSHQISALIGLAYAEQATGKFAAASKALESALEIALSTSARLDAAEIRFAQADTARLTGRNANALEHLAQAETLLPEGSDPDLLWRIHYCAGQIYEALGDRIAAIEALTRAVERIEAVRNRLLEDRFRTGYLQDKHQVYIELVRLQLETGRPKAAFQTAERLRARNFQRWTNGKDLPRLSPEDERRDREHRERIRQLQRALGQERESLNHRQAAIRTFSSELVAAEREYQAFLDDRNSDLPADALEQSALPVEVVQRHLADNELLVEYLVGENLIMIFAIDNDNIWTDTVSLSRRNLRSRVELLRDLLGRPGDDWWAKPAASLGEALIGPLERRGLLDRVETLYVVPHGYLNYVPYSLLQVSFAGKAVPLMDHVSLSYLPTAAALGSDISAPGGVSSLLAVAPASSRLKFAHEEVRSVNALFVPNSTMLLGRTATESQFKELSSRYRILHVATHGIFNRLNPMFSSLQFEADDENDGRLEVHEVLRLELHADLVTLSACETGLGSGYFAEVPAGDEFVGLTRAFLSVGTNSVVATLWEVDDESTVRLMTRFYTELRKGGRGTQEALLLAQQHLRTSKNYEHPFYWAPFIHIGRQNRKIEFPEISL